MWLWMPVCVPTSCASLSKTIPLTLYLSFLIWKLGFTVDLYHWGCCKLKEDDRYEALGMLFQIHTVLNTQGYYIFSSSPSTLPTLAKGSASLTWIVASWLKASPSPTVTAREIFPPCTLEHVGNWIIGPNSYSTVSGLCHHTLALWLCRASHCRWSVLHHPTDFLSSFFFKLQLNTQSLASSPSPGCYQYWLIAFTFTLLWKFAIG